MEDSHTLLDKYLDDPKQAFFAIYDGHGGKSAADYSAANLHLELAKELKSDMSPEEILCALTASFSRTDSSMKETVPAAGCTAVVCLLKEVTIEGKPEKSLFVANAGDARAILSKAGKATRLTYEHKATDPAEQERIKAAGGFILNDRVNGLTAVSRSLGDHHQKDFIIGDPHTQFVKLEESDDFLIVACDGLWDALEDQQAVDMIREEADKSPIELCKKLYLAAVKGGSEDNITVVVVKL